MGFWIFMTFTAVLMPAILLGTGKLFCHRPPQKINYIWGYRTKRSMQNQQTWLFAQRYFAKTALVYGKILLPLSFIAMLFVYGRRQADIGFWASAICIIQIPFLFVLIWLTERALKRSFDDDGQPVPPHDMR